MAGKRSFFPGKCVVVFATFNENLRKTDKNWGAVDFIENMTFCYTY